MTRPNEIKGSDLDESSVCPRPHRPWSRRIYTERAGWWAGAHPAGQTLPRSSRIAHTHDIYRYIGTFGRLTVNGSHSPPSATTLWRGLRMSPIIMSGVFRQLFPRYHWDDRTQWIMRKVAMRLAKAPADATSQRSALGRRFGQPVGVFDQRDKLLAVTVRIVADGGFGEAAD